MGNMLNFMLYYIVGNITTAIIAFVTVMWVGTIVNMTGTFKSNFKDAIIESLELIKEIALMYMIIVQPFIIWILLSSW